MVEPADDEVDDGGLGPGGERGGVAADGSADDGEDSRADDSPDAERGERDRAEGLAEGVLGPLRLGDELVDGFGGEDLPGQRRTPCGQYMGREVPDSSDLFPMAGVTLDRWTTIGQN